MALPQRDRTRPIADSHVFDLRLSWKGYRINKLCNSLSEAANRDAYRADEEAYMTRFGLSDDQKALVRRRQHLFPAQAGRGHRQRPLRHGRADARRKLRGLPGHPQRQGSGLTWDASSQA